MVEWLLERLGLVIFLVIFLAQVFRAIVKSRKAAAEHTSQTDDSAEQRRVREIQEQIRRQIVERRGGNRGESSPPPLPERETRPVPRPHTTQMPEPFGGPLGRMLEELQKRAQPPSAPPPPPVQTYTRNTAEIERQERLTEELRVAEEARVLTQRRAAYLAEDVRTAAGSEAGLRSVARDELLGELSDAGSLRRAFVLREVLGTPVGLR